RGLVGAGAQFRRVDVEGEGVQVDDAVEGVVGVLVGNPVPDRAQVVAQMQVATRLQAGENSGHGGHRRSTPTGARNGASQPVWSDVVTATVSTPVFDGPADVLLQLVNRHQAHIFYVPLASVVVGFGADFRRWAPVDLQTLSEFLVIASALIELKSRRLLPGSGDV